MADPISFAFAWAARGVFSTALIGGVAGLHLLFTAGHFGPPLPDRPQRLTLVTRDGELLDHRPGDNASDLKLDALPDDVRKVIIGSEDHRFRRHVGVRLESSAAAFLACITDGGECRRGGASTIEQQVARGGRRDANPALRVKLWEMYVAVWIRRHYGKDWAEERYLEDVYFGRNIYGLPGAAKFYFRRDPKDLAIGEAAYLAGMLGAPNGRDPFDEPDVARKHQRRVLDHLLKHELITADQYRRARSVRPPKAPPKIASSRAFVRWVASHSEIVQSDEPGIRIATSLDADLQRAAMRSVQGHLQRRSDLQAAVVVMDLDGRILTMVGGRSARDELNHAIQARRSFGSAFKLFTYTEALRQGYTPEHMVDASPLRIGLWRPRNSMDRVYGTVSMETAFAESINTAALRLAGRLGRDNVIGTTERLGIELPPDIGPAHVLGARETTLLDMTAAYAGVIGNCGPVAPTFHKVAAERTCKHQLPKPQYDAAVQMMRATTRYGTGRNAGRGLPSGGKTGTSQHGRDGVFIGWVDAPAGTVVIGVWVGVVEGRPKWPVSGSGLPSSVWNDVGHQAMTLDSLKVAER